MLLAPLLPGIINKVKARWQADVDRRCFSFTTISAKLWRKGVVLSTLASPGFRRRSGGGVGGTDGSGNVDAPGAGGKHTEFSRRRAVADFTCWRWRDFARRGLRMETGSAFEGMGAAREVSYAVLAEAAIIAAVLS